MTLLKRFSLGIAIFLVLVLAAMLIIGYNSLVKAEASVKAGEYRAAAEDYIRASRFLFWRKDLQEEAAFAALQSGDISTAIYYLERAPRTQRGQLALAYAYYQIGDLDSAQKTFEDGARLYHAAPFYEGLAFIFHRQGKWEEELRAAREQIQLDMGNASAHYRLGVLLTALEPESALSELMLAASLDPQFDSSVQTLRAALNLSAAQPDSSEQMITIGRALGLIDEWGLALFAFQNAVDLDSKNPEAWAWLGEANQHNQKDGRAELNRALALDSKSSIVRGLRAQYWNRQKNYQQSLAEYFLAAEYDPQNPVWMASIGDAYSKSGDLVSALTFYQRATELAPQESQYWRMLAVFCADNGVNVEDVGLPAAQKSVDLAPDDPLAVDALGYLYYSVGKFANAEKILSDAAARFPNHYPARLHLALNYLAQGNHAAALKELTYVRDADKGGADGDLAARLIEQYFP